MNDDDGYSIKIMNFLYVHIFDAKFGEFVFELLNEKKIALCNLDVYNLIFGWNTYNFQQ